MKEVIKIVGLGGSLGDYSTGLAALNIALQAAEEEGAIIEVFDLAVLNLPLYSPSEKEIPENVANFCQVVHEADALIWCSPLYHGSVSGLFKNAIDWLELLHDKKPAYLANKPIGLIGVAGGIQAMQAVNSMEYMVRALRAWTIPFVVPINRSWQIFIENEPVKDKKVEQQLQSLGRETVTAAKRFTQK